MTRTEIDELITYLEKNYHVKCEYVPEGEFTRQELIVTPNLSYDFSGFSLRRQHIIAKLDELDLIKF